MNLGYFMMPLHPPGSNVTETLDSDMEQVILCDQLGFNEVWVGEHFTAEWENIPAPDLFLSKAIGLTKNITLATGVSCMPNHNPFVLAHRIALLDHLAHGRFIWGIGTGGFPGDFEVFGVDPSTGIQNIITKNSLDLILQMWKNPQPKRYKSDHWDFSIPKPISEIGLKYHFKPYQKPHPPIAMSGASRNSKSLEIASANGWIPISINLIPVEALKTHRDAINLGAEKSGKIPDRSNWRIARQIYVADSTKSAYTQATGGTMARDYHDYFLPLLKRSKLLDYLKKDPNMPDRELTIKYFAENIWIIGSPNEVSEKIFDLYESVDGFGTIVALGHEWVPKEEWVNSHTVLAKEIIPKLPTKVKNIKNP